MATRIQLRRDTSANWTSLNPTLSSGEVGFETNTNQFKIGDGSTNWAGLAYFSTEVDLSAYATTSALNSGIVSASAAAVSYLVDSAPGALDTLNELAAALNDDASFASTVTTSLANKLDLSLNIIAEKTGAYTIASGDEGDFIQLSGSNAYTVRIPTDATFNFAVGTQINLLNTGTGVKTIAAVTPGTTSVNGTPGLKLRAQWSSATLIKLSSNRWVVVGDLSA